MELDRRTCDRARRSRDARFDGRFFIAVTTTRIYCRPICPVRAPRDEHVRYFSTAAAAEAAGFRPCLRCRPEASPGTPAWFGTSGVVSRALRLISEGALDEEGVEAFADRLGVTARHLRRLFLRHLGASPFQVALTRRAHFAKKLLDETALPVREVAMAAGFGSVRRFNAHIRKTYSRTPTELRRRSPRRDRFDPDLYRFRLAYRPPYDWRAALRSLRANALSGVESVEGGTYRRTIRFGERSGVIAVSHLEPVGALSMEVRFPDPRMLLAIVERVRRMFDLDAVSEVIAEHLSADPMLRPLLAKHPGIRNPDVWDGFERLVREALGRDRARDLAAMFGEPIATGWGLHRLFPTPARLRSAFLERAGLSSSEAAIVRSAARGRAPGVEVGEPDRLPENDPVLLEMTGCPTFHALEHRSERWRPWRAYAAQLLFQEAEERRVTHATRDPSRFAPAPALRAR